MTTALAVLLSVICALCTLIVGFRGHSNTRDANSIDRFEAIVVALEGRVSDLERELGNVKQALVTEQGEHTHTRRIRDTSLRYIREVLTWRDRRIEGPMPSPSSELQAEL